MNYRPYDKSIDYYPMLKLLDQMLIEVHQDDMNRIFEGNGLKINGIEGKLCTYLEDGCSIQIAESKGRMVGFLIYHLIFDTIMVCRGIYFAPEYRKKSGMYGIMRKFVRNGVKKIYSQTFEEHEPAELQGERGGNRIVKRKLLDCKDGMNVWEATVGV